jgi:hypothetical protein
MSSETIIIKKNLFLEICWLIKIGSIKQIYELTLSLMPSSESGKVASEYCFLFCVFGTFA